MSSLKEHLKQEEDLAEVQEKELKTLTELLAWLRSIKVPETDENNHD